LLFFLYLKKYLTLCRLVDWYGDYLHRAAASIGFSISKVSFASKLILESTRAGSKEVSWSKIIKKPPQEHDYKRVIYPNYFDSHFTIVVLDLPNNSRSARAVYIDPMQEYRPEIRNAFSSWFQHRQFLNMSHIHVHGGIQGDNETECGVFAMLNLDALLTTKPFFSLADWKKDSEKRDCSTCLSARIAYAAVLRNHIIQYICRDGPFHLPQYCQELPRPPPSQQVVRLFTDAETKEMHRTKRAQRHFAKMHSGSNPKAKRKADVVAAPAVDEFAIYSDEEHKCPRAQCDVRAPVLSAESAPTLAPAAAAPVHVCDCYTKCQGTCVNAPIEGPRKRGKKPQDDTPS